MEHRSTKVPAKILFLWWLLWSNLRRRRLLHLDGDQCPARSLRSKAVMVGRITGLLDLNCKAYINICGLEL